MFCASCGKPVPPNSQFCPACGGAVAAAAPTGDAPPAPAPAPAPASAAPQAKKRGFFAGLGAMKLWQKILLGVFVFIVLVIALALFATGGLDKPVSRHFAALRSGDLVGAYAELSIAARQQTSLDGFKQMVESNPPLTHVAKESFTSRSVSDGQGKLEGALEVDGGGKLPIEIRLVKENGQWKILGYHLSPTKPTE